MQKLKFINANGSEIEFHNSPPYIFWEIKGLDIPELSEISTQASGQHGYTLHDILIDGRTVRLSCHIHGPEGVRQMYGTRRKLNAVCNPTLGEGELVYTNDYGSWRIKAYAASNPYDKRIQSVQTLNISFRCPDGVFESEEQFRFDLAYIEGGLEFPLETPTEFGLFGYRVVIDNDGDMATPLELYMDGGSLNPVIKNQTTGEFIKLDKQLQYFEKLYINTDPKHMEVSLISIDPETNEPVRSNAYGYLADDSTLFKLAPGQNAVTFNSDDEENKNVSIRGLFRKRFIGV